MNTNPSPGLLTIFEDDCFLPVDPCRNEARIVLISDDNDDDDDDNNDDDD